MLDPSAFRKLFFCLLLTFQFGNNQAQDAPADTVHWTHLIEQPRINYYKIKSAFERDMRRLGPKPEIGKDTSNVLDVKERNEGLYNLFKRWEYFTLPKIDKEGNYDATKEAQKWNTYLEKSSKNPNATAAANWQPIGPFRATTTTYANNGRVECLAFHPTDANTFYIGAPSGGVWKTTDGGVNFQYLSQNWNDQNVTTLALHPTSTSTIFALKYSNYFMKSTDGGASWSQINFTNGNYGLYKFLINPTNPQIMLVNSYDGILRSTDGGATWTKYIFSANTIEDIKFKPNDPNTVYATSSKTVYKSTDGGITFTAIYTLPTSSIAANIAVTPAAPNALYLVYVTNIPLSIYYSQFGAMFKSTDGGASFTTITDINTTVNSTQTLGTTGIHQGRYDLTLAVSPTNENHIWLGMVSMFKTTNGGASWNYLNGNNVSIHADHHATEFQPSTNKLFIACDGGLYRYTQATDTYEILDGMNITQIYRISGLKNSKSKILYGAQDNGTHKYEVSTFTNISGGDGMECIIDHTNNNTLYASYQNGELIKSTNNGVNWTTITPNPFPANPQWVTPWEMHPTNNQIMYACYKEIYKTTDGGSSWNAITNLNVNSSFRFVKIAPSDPNILYAFITGNLIKSTNGGTSWTNVNLPNASYFARDIAISANDPNKIWIASYDNVSQSTDGGLNWTTYTGSISGTYFTCLLIDKTNNDLYAGTGNGVFVRSSGSPDWLFYNDNMPKVMVQELEISYIDGNWLRVATYGRGLWETPTFGACAAPTANITAGGSTVIPGGGSVVLQANTGSGISYQWYKNGLVIANATASSYTATDIGDYTVLVSNSNCSKFSNSITVTTSASLSFVTQPSTTCGGSIISINFNAANFASGTTFTAKLVDVLSGSSYVTVSGTTSPLTINVPTSINTSNQYKITISASSPSILISSNNFEIKTVTFGIGNANNNFLVSGSTSVAICPGKSVKLFAVKTNNTMPSNSFIYQWKLNGVDISGQTDSTITVSQYGNYTVRVNQGNCILVTNPVSIYNSTYITPTLRAVGGDTQCSKINLESTYTTTTATYQWKKDGVIIPSANQFSYLATTSGFYTLTVSDGSGCTLNPVVRDIRVGRLGAAISTSDSILCNNGFGNNYCYMSMANSTTYADIIPNFQNIIYKWQRNGQDIINSPYTGTYFYATSEGIYSLKLKQENCEAISNPLLIKTSSSIPVSFTMSYPTANSYCTGQNVYLYASGNGTFTWQKDGLDVLNNYSYNVTTSGTYRLKRTMANCTGYSDPITLNIGTNITPVLSTTNNATKACTGIYLYVYNTYGTMTYQWRKNGIDIPNSNNSYYYANSSGNYDVVVSNSTCSGTSNPLTITIGSIEGEILSTPLSYCSNSVQRLSINKFDIYNSSSYQWKRNGVAIPGATIATYNADLGASYTVSFTQGSCTFETPPIVLPARVPIGGSLSGNTTITGGTTGNLTVNLTGNKPWAVTLSDGNTRYTSSSPLNITVNPSTTQTYQITTLTDGCSTLWACTPNWNITAGSEGTIEKYQAQQVVTSTSAISNASNIEYNAGKSILLNPGFKVQNGAIFKAQVLGCSQ